MASPDAYDKAMNHAWAWFSLHAAQRMQVVSSFLVTLTLIVAGYGAALQLENQAVAMLVSSAGVVMCVGFLILEVRTRALIKVAEPALDALEQILAKEVELSDLRFVERAENANHHVKYSTAIRILMISAILLLGLAFVASFWIGGEASTCAPPHR